jgi:hypothetical protein
LVPGASNPPDGRHPTHVTPLASSPKTLEAEHPFPGFGLVCTGDFFDGAYRDRTDDLLLAKQALSQLS